MARVRGKDLQGVAQAVEADAPALLDAVQQVYRGIPAERAAHIASEVVMIRITIN